MSPVADELSVAVEAPAKALRAAEPLRMEHVFRTWWPLAASWILMGAELPALSAVVARLPQAEINLAAYGGVVYPLALIIESPIIMLLSASTALCKDEASYRKVYRFMMLAGAALTLLHLAVALTPLFYVVTRDLLGVPAQTLEPARLGLIIMTPWSWAIAYRRFQQGMLIRFGRSRAVGMGTAVRLLADASVLGLGYTLKLPGIVVATSAVIAGVVSEAAYAGLVSRPVVREVLPSAPAVRPALTLGAFLNFYIPLVLTSLLSLAAQPIGSAALSRMPQALASLAAWPVVSGLAFMLRCPGLAYNEVVVALLDEPRSVAPLRRFMWLLAILSSGGILVMTVTPLASFWFQTVSALEPHLAALAQAGLWLTVPLPVLAALQSWFQGALLNRRSTRGIGESVAVFLVTTLIILAVGVAWQGPAGLYVGLVALLVSSVTQTAWLWLRSRRALADLSQRDLMAASQTQV